MVGGGIRLHTVFYINKIYWMLTTGGCFKTTSGNMKENKLCVKHQNLAKINQIKNREYISFQSLSLVYQ